MITIDRDLLEAIKSLEDSQDARWVTIQRWISDNAIRLGQEVLHAMPNMEDTNFIHRSNLDRGTAIAFDVIHNTIVNVDQMLNDQRRSDVELEQLKLEGEEMASDAMS